MSRTSQVPELNSHIRAFTSRMLSHENDSLSAFLGVAARYSTGDGPRLLLKMPVWAGQFANSKPGVQHNFALSLAAWMHVANRMAEGAEAGTRWVRIGRLAMRLKEGKMNNFKSTSGTIDSLPVKKFESDVVLI